MLLMWVADYSGEPSFEGRTLSEWCALPIRDASNPARAVRTIGTNGIPFFLAWLEETDSWSDLQKRKLNGMQSLIQWSAHHAVVKQLNAVNGFFFLGEQGAPALPELVRGLKTGKPGAGLYAHCLVAIGPSGLEALVRRFKDASYQERTDILDALVTYRRRLELGLMAGEPKDAEKWLIDCLDAVENALTCQQVLHQLMNLDGLSVETELEIQRILEQDPELMGW